MTTPGGVVTVTQSTSAAVWKVTPGGSVLSHYAGAVPPGAALLDASGHISAGVVPDLSATYAALAAVTDMPALFVTAHGSDANDGRSPGKAKATIASALAALGSTAGLIQLGAGTFTISAADGNGNGVTLTAKGQCIRGVGFGQASTIVIDADSTWGIKAQAEACSVEDVYVTIASGKTVTYGVGVSPATSPGSAQLCHFDRAFVNVQGACTAAYALGPDFPGSSSIDIANTKFDNCSYDVSGTLTHGWLSGNGTTGNVTANTAVSCTGSGSTYGITLNGSGFQWFGGGFANLTSADIHIQHAHGDGAYFAGMRCENGNQALNTTYGGGTGPIMLDGCSFQAYTPTAGTVAGEIITYNLTGPLILQSGCYTTTGANTSFHVNDSSGIPARIFMALGVAADVANPYPAASSKVTRVILGATYYNAGTPTPNPSVSVFDSWSPPFDSTAATVKVGSAQTGNVRLQVGSDAAAQTPVLDFKSSGSAPNYDARFLASSGTSSNGNGDLRFIGGFFSSAATMRPNADNTYDLGTSSLGWRNGYFKSYVRVGAVATGSRPSASTAGAGAHMFDATLGKPIWSNGTAWVDATGATV